jgi:RNA polymerase sigma-70 factor (ECF subfamily)
LSGDEPVSEAELVTRARGGDHDAFHALWARYEERLRARVGPRLRGPLQRKISVADVLQETCLTAHARLGAFEDRGGGAFGAWLAGIAERKAKEAVRHYAAAAKRDVRRERSRGLRPDTNRVAGAAPTPSEVAVGKERATDVARAMAVLPEDYRAVVSLVRVEGMTLQDAAGVLGRSYEATKKLYGRALSRLADLLDVKRTGDGHE